MDVQPCIDCERTVCPIPQDSRITNSERRCLPHPTNIAPQVSIKHRVHRSILPADNLPCPQSLPSGTIRLRRWDGQFLAPGGSRSDAEPAWAAIRTCTQARAPRPRPALPAPAVDGHLVYEGACNIQQQVVEHDGEPRANGYKGTEELFTCQSRLSGSCCTL